MVGVDDVVSTSNVEVPAPHIYEAVSEIASETRSNAAATVPKLRRKSSSVIDIRRIHSQLKVEEKTPWQQDLELQIQRILEILEKAILKIKQVGILSRWVRKEKYKLYDALSEEDANMVVEVAVRYLDSYTKSVARICPVQHHVMPPSLQNKKELLDPQMTHVIDMLWVNKRIRETMFDDEGSIEDKCLTLMECLKGLKEAISEKLQVTAEEERNREAELQNAYNDNIICRQEIQRLEDMLIKQREDLGTQLAAKENLIAQYEEKIETIENQFKETIRQRIKQSEKKMVMESIASDARQAELAIEAKNATAKYDLLLEQNLADEKLLRAKRLKIEQQLAQWLAKFDADIGERNTEFEEVQAEYDKEKAEMDALQEKMDEQDEEYTVVMQEKQDELKVQWEIRALLFLHNRSARIIQRAWKAYKERKALRKKKRKARAKRAAQAKLEKIQSQMETKKDRLNKAKEAKEQKEKEEKAEAAKPEPEEEKEEIVEPIPGEQLLSQVLVGAVPPPMEGGEGGEGEVGEGEEEGETKPEKVPKKKGDKKKKEKKIRKGEIPKQKKDVHLTKEGDAVELLDKAFGGELQQIDTSTVFEKGEVKVDLSPV